MAASNEGKWRFAEGSVCPVLSTGVGPLLKMGSIRGVRMEAEASEIVVTKGVS